MVQTKKRIIIIDHEPFSEQRKVNYFVEDFVRDNFDVFYWEVKDVFAYSKKAKYNFSLGEERVLTFSNFKELLDSIKKFNTSETVFIIELPFNWETVVLYKILAKIKANYIKLDYYSNPISSLDAFPPISERIRNFSFNNILSKLANRYILNRFYAKYNSPALQFISGSSKPSNSGETKFISLDYFDVVNFNSAGNNDRIVKEKYVVFLDNMLLNHPDIKLWRYDKETISGQYYYSKVNDFFDFIESTTTFKVVIASHPKANYQNEFFERKCIKGRTMELVKDCEFVITHGSLSISYALLYRKPLLYFYMGKSFRKNAVLSYILHRIFKAKQVLDSQIIDIEEEYKENNIDQSVNVKKYESFLNTFYRKEQLDDRSNYSIIREEIVELLKTTDDDENL